MKTKLEEIRTKNGETQAELAESVGAYQSDISRYENGKKRSLNKDVMKKIAEHYGVSVGYIFFDENDDVLSSNGPAA